MMNVAQGVDEVTGEPRDHAPILGHAPESLLCHVTTHLVCHVTYLRAARETITGEPVSGPQFGTD